MQVWVKLRDGYAGMGETQGWVCRYGGNQGTSMTSWGKSTDGYASIKNSQLESAGSVFCLQAVIPMLHVGIALPLLQCNLVLVHDPCITFVFRLRSDFFF